MNLLIISDLHLGNRDRFETFGWDEDFFIKSIDSIVQHHKIDKIILNGDIFELYKYNFEEVVASNPNIIEYFELQKAVYIRGNHDILSPWGQDYFQITNSEGKTIHIEHGHNADFLNGTSFGRFFSIRFFKILKKLCKNKFFLNLYLKAVLFDEEISRIPKKYNTYKYLKYALNLLKKYDVVVLGHTHKIETHKTYYLHNKKHYINCGSCSLGRLQAAVLNTESLEYETLKFNFNKIDKIIKFNNHYQKPISKKKLAYLSI